MGCSYVRSMGKGYIRLISISIRTGTLLGLVPGVMYNSYSEIKDIDDESHFFRFDGRIFSFEEKLYYPIKSNWS